MTNNPVIKNDPDNYMTIGKQQDANMKEKIKVQEKHKRDIATLTTKQDRTPKRSTKRGERLRMTVTFDVTEPQAIALEAMFNYWCQLSSMGSSRFVAFYCDGDGDFHPKCKIGFSRPIITLTDDLAKKAVIEDKNGNRKYDYDPVSWSIRDD